MNIQRLQTMGGEGGADSQGRELIHILFVIDQLGAVLGGGERVALRLASLLPNLGFRASILTFSIHPDCPLSQNPGCPIYVLPLQRTYDLRAMQAVFALRRFLREQDVRIVQTFFESSDLWAGIVTRLTSEARLVWSRRDMGILRTRKHQLAYRMMSSLPHAVFAVSDQVREFSIAVDRISPDRVHTVYNGIDISAYGKVCRVPPEGEIRIATVGNIRRVKGHDVLLGAAPLILKEFPRAVFSIAGQVSEPDYFAELKEISLRLGIANRVRFEGGVEHVPKYLDGAHVFVLPSRSEGFSNSLVEAMAASLPVVATRVGGNGEAVEDGVTGLLIPTENPPALADAVLSLLSDRSMARAMGEAGYRRVAREFTTEAMLRRSAELYHRVLSANPQATLPTLAQTAR
jgi:glycosyltransferase involved in cell wall biosynthesis